MYLQAPDSQSRGSLSQRRKARHEKAKIRLPQDYSAEKLRFGYPVAGGHQHWSLQEWMDFLGDSMEDE